MDHRGTQAGPLSAILFIDMLNDFFAPLMLKVDINVGRLAALLTDKPLKQQAVLRRVHRRDPKYITNGRIGR